MKAIRVEKQGGPEVLKLLDIAPLEAPGPGQAVVRVAAAGVNFLDVGQRRGTYPRQVPFTLGVEGAGVVESVGEGVRNLKPSDRVAFTGLPGAYAEAILAEAERLIPLPDEFTFEQGAAFPLQFTAIVVRGERRFRGAAADFSATRRSPAQSSRIAGWELASHRVGLPMLTRFSFARMSTPLPHGRGSEGGHLLQLFRIPSSLYRDRRGGAFDLAEIALRKFDVGRFDVFFETMQFSRARDWNNPGSLGK